LLKSLKTHLKVRCLLLVIGAIMIQVLLCAFSKKSCSFVLPPLARASRACAAFLNRSTLHFGSALSLLIAPLAMLFVFATSSISAEVTVKRVYKATESDLENARLGFTGDGFKFAEPFLLKNVETGLYLKAISQRKLRMRKYIANDITFEWIKPNGSEGIFSAWDGLAISGTGDVGSQAYTADQISDHWVFEENPNQPGEFMIVHPKFLFNAYNRKGYSNSGQENPGGLRVYDGRTIVRSKQSFSDKKYVWVKEKPPNKGRDLAILRIENVQAIKTSAGTDEATEALFTAIDIAVEYGSTIASGGAALGKLGAAQLAKRAAAKAARDSALRHGGKVLATHLAQEAAKKAAKKSLSQQIKTAAKKAIIKKAGDKAVAAASKGLTAVWKKEIAKAAAKKIAKKLINEAAELSPEAESELLIETYEEAADKTDDPEVKAVFADLAKVERNAQPKISADLDLREGTEVEYPYTVDNLDIHNLRNKKDIYLELLNDPLNKLTTQDLTDLWQSLSNVDESIDNTSYRGRVYDPILNAEMRREAPIAKAHLLEQYRKKYILSANVKQSDVAPTPLTSHPLYAPIGEKAEIELRKYTKRLAAEFARYDATITSALGISDANACAFEKPFAPLFRNIPTRGALEALPEKNTLMKALPKGYGAGLLTAIDPKSLTNSIKALAQDTPDQLEIKINDMSAWPNGGGDWRTIKMHQVKNVGVEVVFDRRKPLHIELKEHDSASANDYLGSLVILARDLVGTETYERAYIRNESEKSIYVIDLKITGLNGTHKTVEPCKRQFRASQSIYTAVKEFENSVKELHKEVSRQRARIKRFVSVPQTIQKRFGDEGLQVFNTLLDASKKKITCPADDADYGRLLAGDWRLGVYDNLNTKRLQQTNTNYTFYANGTYRAGYQSIKTLYSWSKVPGVCALKTTYGKIVVSSEKDGLVLYTKNDIPRDLEPMRLARNEFSQTQFTDENGKLQLGPPEGIDYTGYGRWLQKIDDHPLSTEKVTEFAGIAKPKIIGIWDVPGGNEHRWTITSDNLFVSTVKIDKAFKAVTGRWKYIGDKRLTISLDEEFVASEHGANFSSLGKEFRIHLPVWSHLEFDDFSVYQTGEYWREYNGESYQGVIHIESLDATAEKKPGSPIVTGSRNRRDFELYPIATQEPNDETVDKLIALRKELDLPVPEEEVDELTEFLKWRVMNTRNAKLLKLIREDWERRWAKTVELKQIWEKSRQVAKAYDDERFQLIGSNNVRYNNSLEGKCGTLSPNNKQKFVGDWTVELFDAFGKKTVPTGKDAEWSFQPAGILSGSFDGKPWKATWTDEHRCFGKVVFDDETAKNYGVGTEIEIEVRFSKNGDRRLFVMEHDPFFSIERKKLQTTKRDDRLKELDYRNPRDQLGYGKFKWHWPQVHNRGAMWFEVMALRGHHIAHNREQVEFSIEQKPLADIQKQRLQTEAELQLSKLASGDRKLFTVVDGETNTNGRLFVEDEVLVSDGRFDVFYDTLAVAGTNPVDPEDALRFVVNYDELIITNAGLANRCSETWVNNDIGPGKKPKGRPIGFDLRSVAGPSYNQYSTIKLYKVNFEGPEAELLYSGSVGDTDSRDGRILTHIFDGVIGDEFVVLDGNECRSVFKTKALSTTPARGAFTFDESTITNKVGESTTHANSSETSLYFDAEYSDVQKTQGCETVQWTQPDRNLRGNEKVDRRIGNTNSYDIYVYGVDSDGNYPSQKPVLTVKPGEMKTLKAVIGERYPVFKKDFTCEAVATITSERYRQIQAWIRNGMPQDNIPHKRVYPTDDPQIILGDGSTPIDHPDYLNPAQVANGCLDFGNATSIRSDNKSIGHVANSGSSDIFVHWIGYNGKYDADRPNFTVKPGQTALLTDFKGAKYQLLDKAGECVGIVGLARFDETSAIGDGSTPITGDVIDKFEVAGIKPVDDLSKHQIANGCSAYGKIASTPNNWKVWQPKIINSGTKPLTVQWMSFYGSLEDGESSRNAKVQYTIPPGELITFRKYSADDVLVVLDGEQCVAVMQGSDRYAPIAGLPRRVESTGSRKTYYVLRDQMSAEAFDERAKQWKLDVISHKAKVKELEARWAKSSCENMSVEKALFGKWNVGSYDFGGREQQFAESPTIWEHKESRFGKTWQGTGPDGKPFSADVSINGCTVEADFLGGVTMKIIVNDDLSSEFFAARQQRPEVLYTDGSLRSEHKLSWRDSRILELDRQAGRWSFEPQLGFWGRRAPVVGEVVDIDKAANEIDESAPIGAAVGVTARATDADNEVSYSLSVSHKTNWTAEGIDEALKIDAKSGVVTVAGELNYESVKYLDLYITATSSDGSQSRMVTSITIADVNDNAVGEITDADHRGFSGSDIANGRSTYVDGLYEYVEKGVGVSITAQADDWDADDTVTYSLSDSSNGMFAIDPKTGVITVAGDLNWDVAKSHDIEVTATSTDGSTSQKTFVIPIVDYNISRVGAISDSDKRSNVVDENAPIGTQVGLTAFAADGDRSDVVVYWIDDTAYGEYFKIDEVGVVTLNKAMNFDGDTSVTINVVAQSSDRSRSYKEFEIAVNDIEQFAVSEITNGALGAIGVRQDAPIGTKINLDADASDGNANDEVTFSIANGQPRPFVIDPKTGEVSVSKPLGASTSFTLDIMATSTDGSISRRNFEVPVEKVNNFKISAISDRDLAINSVAENVPVGTQVGITAFATDNDVYDTVRYIISDQLAPFVIDQKAGVITVSRPLDHEEASKHTIEVVAWSTDQSESSAKFDIVVTNVNEHKAGNLQDSNLDENIVNENAQIGSPVGVTAFAQDDDSGDEVTYKLEDNARGLLALDPKTGVVTVAGPIDFETLKTSGTLSIKVSGLSSDGSLANRGSSKNYTIKVRDVNEFSVSEVSDTNPNANEVHEHAASGTKIGITAFARDGDGDEYYVQKVKYEIVDATGNYTDGPFWIDYQTGVVTVRDHSKIDPDTDNGSVIRIKATSDDGSSKIGVFDFNLIRVERWYNNPKGPRVEADFPKVTKSDHQKCVEADDDFNAPKTYNNEVEFFDCLERHTPVFINWYDNPQWPNILLDYPKVPQEAIDACYEHNEDESLAGAFNNESEFVECLHRYVPPFVNWYDNPQWPNILSEYPLVPQDHIDQCYANNENENIKVAFNNEPEFVRCLQRYVPPFVNWYDNPQWPNILDEYPELTDVHIDGCYTANENKTLTASFNNEEEFVRCLDGFVPPKPKFVNWYDNPQWPNILDEYPLVPGDHIDACYADNENESLTEAFNNEVEFVRCLDRFVPPQQTPETPATFVNWYDNPQWPDLLSSYPQVSGDHIDACYIANEDQNNSVAFNSEPEFVRCLDRYVPEQEQPQQPTHVQKWYENPQGPRTEADFPNVSDTDRAYCIAEDEDVNSSSYNNEFEYFTCLEFYSPVPTPSTPPVNDNVPVTNPGGRPPALDPNLVANGCYAEREASQYLNANETQLTIQNTGSSNLYVYWVNYEGQNTDYDNRPMAHSIVEPNESWDIESARGFVFSILRPDGSCAGIAKTRESRNSFSFN